MFPAGSRRPGDGGHPVPPLQRPHQGNQRGTLLHVLLLPPWVGVQDHPEKPQDVRVEERLYTKCIQHCRQNDSACGVGRRELLVVQGGTAERVVALKEGLVGAILQGGQHRDVGGQALEVLVPQDDKRVLPALPHVRLHRLLDVWRHEQHREGPLYVHPHQIFVLVAVPYHEVHRLESRHTLPVLEGPLDVQYDNGTDLAEVAAAQRGH
mmetsp:Transcript_26683/g.74954  ORF Transcript_26683/g.74954 Transcript_26683/m.74954 type:complete len:209 (-) Transcript_26683:1277-1903(-)